MEEAIEILWSYARREPLDSNGETIVPTVNNSIAAIRILSRLEGWEKESEKRTVKPSEYMELGYVGEKRSEKSEESPCCRDLVARAEDTEANKLENAASPQDSSSVFPPSGRKGYTPLLHPHHTPNLYASPLPRGLLRPTHPIRLRPYQKADDHHAAPTWEK